MLWIIVLILILGAMAATVFYLMRCFRRFALVKKLSKGRKWMSRLIGLFPLVLILCFSLWNVVNTFVVALHLALFWLIADFITLIVRKIRGRGCRLSDAEVSEAGSAKEETGEEEPEKIGKQETYRPYWTGLIVILVTAVYLAWGWYLAHHVVNTYYHVETAKEIGTPIRIVQISDSHLGATFDGDGFAEYMERVDRLSPDLVVITGDFVDDDTTEKDMRKACEALGSIHTTYGIYFIFGNHDRAYFGYRDFQTEDLMDALEKNNVTVLTDESVLVDDRFYIVGRHDSSAAERLPAEQLTEKLDKSKYIIMLDHQPNDYDAEKAAGADLVLSGHTHGGQLIPINVFGELLGINDNTYGKEVRGDTTFIVNSGISDWAVWFKTGTVSEIGVIDVEQSED